MYFPRYIHTKHPGACVAHCKCIDFVCAADYSGVFSALCLFGFLFSSSLSSPQGPQPTLPKRAYQGHWDSHGHKTQCKFSSQRSSWPTNYRSKVVRRVVIANISLICIFLITLRRHYVQLNVMGHAMVPGN